MFFSPIENIPLLTISRENSRGFKTDSHEQFYALSMSFFDEEGDFSFFSCFERFQRELEFCVKYVDDEIQEIIISWANLKSTSF